MEKFNVLEKPESSCLIFRNSILSLNCQLFRIDPVDEAIRLKDNRLGIPLKHQRRVFKKSLGLSMNIPGTGMDLCVVRKMIGDNEGRIKL